MLLSLCLIWCCFQLISNTEKTPYTLPVDKAEQKHKGYTAAGETFFGWSPYGPGYELNSCHKTALGIKATNRDISMSS